MRKKEVFPGAKLYNGRMIKAIVFDCFGVLTSEGLVPFQKKYFGNDPKLMQEAQDLRARVDGGLMDYGDYFQEVGVLANISGRDARAQIEHNVPDEELFAYIRDELKPRYRLGLLSNAARDRLHELFEPWQVALFDAVALSYQTGFVKPDPRAYEDMAERLGMDIQECVLVDDQPRYVHGAKGAQMSVILYESFGQMKRELEVLLAKG